MDKTLIGQSFGHLTIIGRNESKSGKNTWVDARCSCGNVVTRLLRTIKAGTCTNCGCKRDRKRPNNGGSRPEDLALQTFGRLTALIYEGDSKWLCRCSCGKHSVVRTSALKSGATKSCGCLKVDTKPNLIYGHTSEYAEEYRAWLGLGSRKERPPEWDDFAQFLMDVGTKPPNKRQLARKDGRKPHGKGNSYWRNARDERNQSEQLTPGDLPDECIVDFRSLLRATATTR